MWINEAPEPLDWAQKEGSGLLHLSFAAGKPEIRGCPASANFQQKWTQPRDCNSIPETAALYCVQSQSQSKGLREQGLKKCGNFTLHCQLSLFRGSLGSNGPGPHYAALGTYGVIVGLEGNIPC